MENSVKVETPGEINMEQQTPRSGSTTNSDTVPRCSANRKERKRTLTMNSAFAQLRDHIPNVPPDTKLSKIKTLRLAISYIKFLMEILDESNEGKTPRSHHNFTADLALQANNTREKRKRESTVSIPFRVPIAKRLMIFENKPLCCCCCCCTPTLFVNTQPPSTGTSSRKRGRTGWPQYVWAMELRN